MLVNYIKPLLASPINPCVSERLAAHGEFACPLSMDGD